MRRWLRLTQDTACGLCGAGLGIGTVVLEFSNATWSALRCQGCACEYAPVEIPAQTPVQAEAVNFYQRIDAIRFAHRRGGRDWKIAQANNNE